MSWPSRHGNIRVTYWVLGSMDSRNHCCLHQIMRAWSLQCIHGHGRIIF